MNKKSKQVAGKKPRSNTKTKCVTVALKQVCEALSGLTLEQQERVLRAAQILTEVTDF